MEPPKVNLIFDQVTELFGSHITEEQLNSNIKNIEDLLILQTALELKLNFIYRKQHARIIFPIKDILDQISATSINDIYKVLYFALKVQENDSQYVVLLEYINKNLSHLGDECHITCNLKLLQLALGFCEAENNQKLLKQYLVGNSFHDIIYNLLNNISKTVTQLLVTYILPKYLSIKNIDTVYLIELIWKNAIETNNLSTLCSIPDFFLVSGVSSLVNGDKFWFTLQESLISNDSIVQKQALYLLKRAIYSLKLEDNVELRSKVVFWNSHSRDATLTAYQNLFTLFEITREKQLHLIEPAYHLLPGITALHWSWLVCIYRILLSHSHNAVSVYAILNIIKSDWYRDIEIFKIVASFLLPTLNKLEYTQKEELWENFKEFVVKLDNEQFIAVLQISTTIAWVPSICYQFCESVFRHDRVISVAFDLTESILNRIEKLPHRFIRTECTKLAVTFMNKAFLSNKEFNFKDYITLAWILYKDQYFLCEERPSNFEEYIPVMEQMIRSWNKRENNFKEVQVILQISQLYSTKSDWYYENLVKPFVERLFVSEILDTFCMYLYNNVNGEVVKYIQERLITLESYNEGHFKKILSLLAVEQNNERNFIFLYKTCTNILLDGKSNLSQLEVAFQIVTKLVENYELFKADGDLNNIIDHWKQLFLENDEKCHNAHICLSFLQIYCTNIFNMERLYLTSDKLEELTIIFEKILETQSNIVVLELFKQLKYLLEIYENEEVLQSFVNSCFKKLIELKRTDIFKTAINNFIVSLYTNSNICNNNEMMLEIGEKMAWGLFDLAKACSDVAYSLAVQLNNLSKCNANAAARFIPIIVDLLLFGDVPKKDQRAEYIVCQNIFVEGGQIINNRNPNFHILSVRRESINIIQNLLTDKSTDNEERSVRADLLTSILIDKYSLHFNKRYFANSQIHLQKLRILQGLLIVHDYAVTQKQPLIELLMNSICMESHQVSVKFLIIWLLVRLLHDDGECLSKITSQMECTSKIHSSTIIGFIPVLYHIALWRNEESFFSHLLEILLPWTMGAHFNLRLYAQEGFVNVYNAVHKQGYGDICEKFKIAFTCITNVLKNTEREIDGVDKYIFSTFSAQDDYNLQTMYFDIPYITNISSDEYENFVYCAKFNTSGKLPKPFNVKSLDQRIYKTSEAHEQANLIQKKIIPLHRQFDNDDIQRKTSELIVVASLIDKAPNLGGLSRTCEIFGVKQLVINTASVIKTHEFQSVSMSSEKWMDVMEIKSDQLRSFLLHIKEQGYSITGAEQTSDSVQLNTFQFPKKCLILLGNEKEGIPPNLLTLIDTCVEIPQFGVIRSLNVHVAAATFIWEYTKQHMM